MPDTPLDDLSSSAIGHAIDIHRRFGPGLLESVYETLLAKSLKNAGCEISRQVPVPLVLDGIHFEEAFRIDILLGNSIILEIKSVPKLLPIHTKQLLTYLRLMDIPLGLLINFGGETLREGVKRIVNELPSGDSPILRVNRPNV